MTVSMWSAVILIFSSILLVKSHDKPGCSEVDLEPLDSIDRYSRSGVRISRSVVNFTEIGISWSLKDEDAVDVCSFTVHVWKASRTERAMLAKNSHNASTRDWLIVGLEPGTKYEIIVETIYSTKHAPMSWILQSNTMGYGPDSPCGCYEAGTKNNNKSNCDPVTGQCNCKLNTIGKTCDQCDVGFFMHPPHGCVVCDQCPPAKYGGNGSCVVDETEEIVRSRCVCLEGYSGLHCNECTDDYYPTYITEPAQRDVPKTKYTQCNKCNCSTDSNRTRILECFHQTGDCKKCTFITQGPICDFCVKDFEDQSLNKTCLAMIGIRPNNTAVVTLSVIILILCAGVVAFILYRRRLRARRIQRFFEDQWKDYNDDVKFSAVMEDQGINANDKTFYN